MVIVTPPNSTIFCQLIWLFGLTEQFISGIKLEEIAPQKTQELDLAARYILDELGIEVVDGNDELDSCIEKFGLKFPTTREFAELARSSLQKDVDPRDDPDTALMAWLDREEMLFRRLERRVLAERLMSGFISSSGEANVDDFVSFSLSVQNRRKARAGQSLELHLDALFKIHSIRFDRGAETENRNRPDFLFPGHSE